MTVLGMIILVFFAMTGLLAFVLSITRALCQRNDKSSYLLVIPCADACRAEYSVRAAISRINDIGRGEILCLCDDSDSEAADICRRMKDECPYLTLVSKEELKEKLGLK